MKRAFLIVLAALLCLAAWGCKQQKVWTEQETQEKVQQAKQLIDLLEAGDYAQATADFDQDMQDALPEGTLRIQWEAVHDMYGVFTQHLSHTEEQADGYLRVVLTAKFTYATMDITVVFDEEGLIAGLFITEAQAADDGQTPPGGVVEEDVSVVSGAYTMPGKLTLPAQGEAFAAVVIIHGSGPSDMNGSVWNLRPYRDIAWGLAKRGIAVLRFDKRTLTYQQEIAADSESFTVYDESVEDAVSAVALLRNDGRIDPNRIYVLGHSLGGMLLPRIQEKAQANGLIFLAASARSLEDQYERQMEYLIALAVENGTITQEQADEQLLDVHTAVESIRNLTPDSTLNADALLNTPKAYWLDLKDYDPVQAAADIDVPMLFLQGERDYQVTMDDFAMWQTLSNQTDATYQSFPLLGHMFTPGGDPPSAEDYKTPYIPFDESVIDAIAAFIGQ